MVNQPHVYQAGGHVWHRGACMVTGGMCGQGGLCMAGGMHGRGACMVGRACMVGKCAWSQGHAWSEEGHAWQRYGWSMSGHVHILLECILVYNVQLCGFQCITGYSICILVIFVYFYWFTALSCVPQGVHVAMMVPNVMARDVMKIG